MTPPIGKSPRPDIAPELEGEEPTNPRIIAAITKHAPHPSKLRDLVVAVASVAGAVVVVLIFFDNRVAAQTDAGIKAQESRIKALEQQVPQLREEVYQGRLDTQALYKAVMDGKRQDRLERPLPPPPTDGGTP